MENLDWPFKWRSGKICSSSKSKIFKKLAWKFCRFCEATRSPTKNVLPFFPVPSFCEESKFLKTQKRSPYEKFEPYLWHSIALFRKSRKHCYVIRQGGMESIRRTHFVQFSQNFRKNGRRKHGLRLCRKTHASNFWFISLHCFFHR